MNLDKAALVILITLFAVIAFNAILFLSLRRRNDSNQIEMLRRTGERLRQPWQKEEEAMQELSKRVADLKSRGTATTASTPAKNVLPGKSEKGGKGDDVHG